MSATNTTSALDTFPKLLRRNARAHGNRPAFRHKSFGIWQSWTWAQTYAEVRALALGLRRLGLAPGDRIAIAGANRPWMYWAITAAQMLRAADIHVDGYPTVTAMRPPTTSVMLGAVPL